MRRVRGGGGVRGSVAVNDLGAATWEVTMQERTKAKLEQLEVFLERLEACLELLDGDPLAW